MTTDSPMTEDALLRAEIKRAHALREAYAQAISLMRFDIAQKRDSGDALDRSCAEYALMVIVKRENEAIEKANRLNYPDHYDR